MIRYRLVCSNAHDFEAWFRSSEDFEAQARGGLLACPQCGAREVTKALMAPSVVSGRREPVVVEAPSATPANSGEAAPEAATLALPLAALSPEGQAMLAELKALKAKLIEGSEDVGNRFAEEARRIHFGEAPKRSVHGEATREDAEALIEEGIEIMALPVLPDERN